MVSSSARITESLPRRRLTIVGSTIYFTRVAMTLEVRAASPYYYRSSFWAVRRQCERSSTPKSLNALPVAQKLETPAKRFVTFRRGPEQPPKNVHETGDANPTNFRQQDHPISKGTFDCKSECFLHVTAHASSNHSSWFPPVPLYFRRFLIT